MLNQTLAADLPATVPLHEASERASASFTATCREAMNNISGDTLPLNTDAVLASAHAARAAFVSASIATLIARIQPAP